MSRNYWTIDESSYRIDKTAFPSPDEAVQKASECARILGRDIQVYEYRDGVQYEYGMVSPAGDLKPGPNPTKHPPPAGPGGAAPLDLGDQKHAAVLGMLDEVAAELDSRGHADLASEVDAASAVLLRQEVTAGTQVKVLLDGDKIDELVTKQKKLKKHVAWYQAPFDEDYTVVISDDKLTPDSVIEILTKHYKKPKYDPGFPVELDKKHVSVEC